MAHSALLCFEIGVSKAASSRRQEPISGQPFAKDNNAKETFLSKLGGKMIMLELFRFRIKEKYRKKSHRSG